MPTCFSCRCSSVELCRSGQAVLRGGSTAQMLQQVSTSQTRDAIVRIFRQAIHCGFGGFSAFLFQSAFDNSSSIHKVLSPRPPKF